ncbi:MerR family transcriptional regulator [Nocardia rhamnosiphila]|uniref:MerR family transcriptional regulator n=1 Tax=Nocardia rhamnosiphila TaxID=426716 RepID=UPI0004C31603|nr:MerR family transcriptional regulator [Nocardia rhamnosiphila]
MTEGDSDAEGDPEVGFTVSTVARVLGVPVATLRSWIQRYDLGPAQHTPGKHRHYTTGDVAALGRMVDLVRAGASPMTAAKAARAAADPKPVLGDKGPVMAAAERLDSADLLAHFSRHIAHYGVVRTWNLLCRRVFTEIVDRQAHDVGLIEVEHVLSWAITTALHRTVPPLHPTAGLVPVLLACTAGENHILPLEVLRAALAEASVPSVLLGASLPASALAAAIARQPRRPVVALWAQTRHTASPAPIPAGSRVPSRLLLAGPGWTTVMVGLLPIAKRVDTLEEALGEIIRTVHVP